MSNEARPHVYLIDDDPGLATVIQLMLDQAGYTTEIIASGLQALGRVGEQLPDAILLDLGLADVDGLTVLRELRSQPRTRELPVIVLTARPDARCRRDCLDAGATAHLLKPVRPALLVETLRLAVNRLAVD